MKTIILVKMINISNARAHPEHLYSYRMNFAMLSISEPSCCPLNHGPWSYCIFEGS